ncbi:MAG: family 2 glycosyl transferase [Pirellula sp.]|nr:family 2 glycosyl transferase [Pirellula sp.]
MDYPAPKAMPYLSAHKLSVVICAHNPSTSHLTRALEGLRRQTLPLDQWELLLLDNASRDLLANSIDISWHSHGRHVREEKVGLVEARLRAIRETDSEILVFVDVDNVLAPDYLEAALKIAIERPELGAWGGQCIAEFEEQPPPHLSKYINGLALRTCRRDSWSNFIEWTDSHPFGAGMCLRRVVVTTFAEKLQNDPRRLMLGHRGTTLGAAEDFDMIRTGIRLGLGCGVFQSLKLTHLIPADHVREEYFRRLWRGIAFSNNLLFRLDGDSPKDPLRSPFVAAMQMLRILIHNGWSLSCLRIEWEILKGLRDAVRFPLDGTK